MRDQYIKSFSSMKIAAKDASDQASLQHAARLIEHVRDNRERRSTVPSMSDNRLEYRGIDPVEDPEVDLARRIAGALSQYQPVVVGGGSSTSIRFHSRIY